MKKTLIGGLFVVTFALLLFAPMVWADPAIVIKDFFCGLLDGNGNVFVTTTGTIDVITINGVENLRCRASGVPNGTGSAVHWDFDNTGFLCGVLSGGLTEEWKEDVSAAGNATLICKLH
jgi:hypothetical protein